MKKTIIILVILQVAIFHSAAQKIDSALNVIATNSLQEKIYVHYDKDYYFPGETIWIKAYLNSNGRPDAISSNLYLQFADNKGEIIASKKYPIQGSAAKGNIDIPDSLPQGNYYIRAFTPGMLNDDEAFIYKKSILVLKPGAGNKTIVKQSQMRTLQFFPESGNLVDGILTVVAFRSVDQNGMPAEINGIIRTEDGTIITSFKSYHDGIGKLTFKPKAGKKYLADVETETGKKSFQLPEVLPSGVNLKVEDEKNGKRFQLSYSEKENTHPEDLLLVAQINNQVVYETKIIFDDYSSVIGHIITDSLPSGILHFTVFSKDGVPLTERLSFVDNGEYRSNADIIAIKTSTEKRAENILELVFPDSVQRNCSVSVTDVPSLEAEDNDNIYSRFLLTGDLQGYIHNPAYYFQHHNDSTRQALDNLMLTHGWSRFKWAEVLANKFPERKYADNYLINISGIAYGPADKKPMNGGKLNVWLSTEDSSLFTYDIHVNGDGQFTIDSLLFFGRTKIYYTYKDKKGKEKAVLLEIKDDTFLPDITKLPAGAIGKYPLIQFVQSSVPDTDRMNETFKDENKEAKLLDSVKVFSRLKRPVDIINEKYTSEIFRSGGKIMIDNINSPPVDKAMNGLDFVLNRIITIGVQHGTFVNRKNFSLQDNKERKNKIQGPKTTISGPMPFWEVGLFINEVPADLIQLQSLRADQIAMVKFFEAGSLSSGSVYPGGAVVVYLNYETRIVKRKENSKYIEYNGYSLVKEFYNPDYSNQAMNQDQRDIRTTLYWNPDVITDANSKSVKLNFFNNDYSKRFRIVIEGFDSKGQLIHLEKIIGN